ncbi:MAG: serine/threonine-protein kinase [Aureliella sp.]
MPEQTLREIYNNAKALHEPARNEYLDRVCDPSIRDRIDAMLRVDLKQSEQTLHAAAASLGDLEQKFGEGAQVRDSQILRDLVEEIPKPSIEGFTIGQLLGFGGMGLVFQATQTSPIDREVAVKVIKPHLLDPSILARFARERSALAGLIHPNIATLLQAGQTESGAPYFAMELAAGLEIDEYCDLHAKSLDERLQLFAIVCDAIDYAHSKGVVHRDLKPSNIVIVGTEQPQVKVIDFGIASLLEQDAASTRFTQLAQLVGTPLYMSPEQVRGTGRIDARSDVYALGTLLYKLVTGQEPNRPPSKSPTIDEIRQHIETTIPPAPSSQSQFRVPPDLDRIVAKALSKDPELRYASAGEISADISRLLGGKPVLARGPSLTYQCQKFVKRNRKVLLQATVVLLFGVVLGGLIAARLDRLAKPSFSPEQSIKAPSELEARLQKQQQMVKDQAEANILSSMIRKLNAHEFDALRSESLPRETDGRYLGEPVDGDEFRQPSLRAFLEYLARPVAVSTWNYPAPVYDIDFNKTTGLLAVACDDKYVWLHDIRTGRIVKKLGPHAGGVNSLSYSPDGTRLASGDREGAIRLWDTNTWECTFDSGPRVDGGVESLVWSPDGQTIVGGIRYSHLAVLKSTGEETARLSTHSKMRYEQIEFLDNERLFASGDQGVVNCWNVRQGKLDSKTALIASEEPCRAFAILESPTGEPFLLAGMNNPLSLGWNRTGNETVGEVVDVRRAHPICLSMSPDSKWCLSCHRDGTIQSLRCSPDEPPVLESTIAVSNTPVEITDCWWENNDTVWLTTTAGEVLKFNLHQLLGFQELELDALTAPVANEHCITWFDRAPDTAVCSNNLMPWEKDQPVRRLEQDPRDVDVMSCFSGIGHRSFCEEGPWAAFPYAAGVAIVNSTDQSECCEIPLDEFLVEQVADPLVICGISWGIEGNRLLITARDRTFKATYSKTAFLFASEDGWQSYRSLGNYRLGRVLTPVLADRGKEIFAIKHNALRGEFELSRFDVLHERWKALRRGKSIHGFGRHRDLFVLESRTDGITLESTQEGLLSKLPIALPTRAHFLDNDRVLLVVDHLGRADVWHIPTNRSLGVLELSDREFSHYVPTSHGLITYSAAGDKCRVKFYGR